VTAVEGVVSVADAGAETDSVATGVAASRGGMHAGTTDAIATIHGTRLTRTTNLPAVSYVSELRQ
jgi:hypothetical protein